MDKDRETGVELMPKFDASGLITAVVSDVRDNMILMVGHMNAEALAMTMESGIVHFYSRSRQTLWKKGETSGNLLHVAEMRVDCDQDAIWIMARPDGPTCHTGVRSCFYRKIDGNGLVRI